jgi:hypothetical protein
MSIELTRLWVDVSGPFCCAIELHEDEVWLIGAGGSVVEKLSPLVAYQRLCHPAPNEGPS